VFGELEHSWSYWHFDEMGTMDNILWDVISKIENGANVKEALDKAAQELLDEM
jgi:hypothetical protein